jgi:hypothetical protein
LRAGRKYVTAHGTPGAPRIVACVQPRRGHGVTVATYYLARALAARDARALVADLTGRRARLQAFAALSQPRGLTIWSPHIPPPERLGDALARAREQATRRVDVMLLDIDAAYLQRAGGAGAGVDYTLIFIEQGELGMRAADQLARQLDHEPPPYGSVAAVFTRVNVENLEDLPQRTPEYSLPTLGELPADYLLAAGDDYSLTGEEPREPHEAYLGAMSRLARALIQIAGITPTGHTGDASDAASSPEISPNPASEGAS